MSKLIIAAGPGIIITPGMWSTDIVTTSNIVSGPTHTLRVKLSTLSADRFSVGRELVAWLLLITEEMKLVTTSVIFSVSHFHLFVRHFSVNTLDLDLIMGCMLNFI